MYKDKNFRKRNIDEIFEDLQMARSHYSQIRRIFLADGNALALKTEDLKTILQKIKELFPECERIGIYSAPKDILRKSVEELKSLKELGIGIAYLGIESGSDKILKNIKKGVTSDEIVQAGKKIIEAGIKLSATLISGIGSEENLEKHALESARVINEIQPDYVGLLTLLIQEGTELYDQVHNGEFKLLSPQEVMKETKILIENLHISEKCVFRSNHASNYVSLAGTLPEDKENLINILDENLKRPYDVKEEFFRRL
jgi:radical SAM superfamily enzyme YgiQ (UPF0313 family)